MKKLFLIIPLILISWGLSANPNPSPELHINEFRLISTNTWTLQIYLYYISPFQIDSIRIQSNTGSGIAKGFGNFIPLGNEAYIVTLSNNDLTQSVLFNQAGDIITVTGYTFLSPEPLSSEVRYGDVTAPDVLAPRENQSITLEQLTEYILWVVTLDLSIYSLDDTPSSGNPTLYDTAGTCGIMKGKVYDKHGTPVPNVTFFLDFPFETDAEGNYSTPMYARINSQDSIFYQSSSISYVHMEEISYALVPDSIITRDIHLNDTLYTGITPAMPPGNSSFRIFPNPVKDYIIVSWSLDLSSPAKGSHLQVTDLNGRIVLTDDLTGNIGVKKIPVSLSSGIYIASLISGKKVIGSTRFVVGSR